MAKKHVIKVEGIGLAELRINTQAKSIKIGMDYSGIPYLIIPAASSITEDRIISILRQKAEWIKHHQERIKQWQTIFTPETEFHTYRRKLSIKFDEKINVTEAYIYEDALIIVLAKGTPIESNEVQLAIRREIEGVLQMEARKILPNLVRNLASKHGFRYNKVTVKNIKTRWGSCSSKQNINLNIHLMRLPKHLIEYVILHELAHTVEPNHSKRFWDLLEKVCPKSEDLNEELEDYHIKIY